MKKHTDQDSREKKIWETPQLTVVAGLDSCVEFLYLSNGGQPLNNELPPK